MAVSQRGEEVKTIYDYERNARFYKVPVYICYESAVLLSSRARTSRRPLSFDASPSVSWVTPSAVQMRYEGIAWYVSARIYKKSVSRPKRERPRTETCLSVFDSDGSKNVVRITDAIQRWNVAFICVGFIYFTRCSRASNERQSNRQIE